VDEAIVKELLQSHTKELSNEDLLELEKELSDEDDESSDVVPVNTLQQSSWLKFLSTLTLPLTS
jgi:hypothetical protein